ncbi:hypothetical protein [Ehrlichia japonica]|uniref:hypothetical protein n=1 Tax=Ehrlichia japonica TaxID=391036 RepID=UPI0012EBA1FB|nr:hypothetical protein [Ehrlichia japonica]
MKTKLFPSFLSPNQRSAFLQSLYLSIREKSSSLYPSTYVIDVTIDTKKSNLVAVK